MDTTLLAAMLIVGVTGVVFGMTGFGFALVSVPPLLLLYDPEMVVALTIGVSLLTSAIVVLGARRDLDGRLVLSLLPGAISGLLLGAWVLNIVDPTVLKVIAGALVTCYSLLLLRGYQPTGLRGPRAASVAGAVSGLLATSTGLSGPPIVILFTARQLPRDAFRVTIAAYFVAIDAIGFTVLLAGRSIGEREVVTSALLTPPAALGALAGTRLVTRLTASGFRTLTLGLLLLTGLMGIGTALVALL